MSRVRRLRRRGATPTAPPLEFPRSYDGATTLDQALANGAYGLAQRLFPEVRSAVEDGDPETVERVLPVVLDYLLATGGRDEARALATRHRAALERSARGVTLLDLLGLRSRPTLWLPGGRPNFVGITRRLLEGTLSAEGLARSMISRPWALLREPQLYLALFVASRKTERELASRFLTRFFRTHGLPACRLAEGTTPFAGLEFAVPEPISGGPLVSIVMSAFDAEATIGHAVDSLLRQTYRNLELLICDDGSRDGTLETLRRRYRGHPRVRLFRSERNQGPYNVRNALLQRARGQFLTFHDADDVALPTRVEAQVRAMQRLGAAACVTSWLRMTPDGRIVFFKDQNAVRLSVVSLMMTRDTFRLLGPYRPARHGADLEYLEDIRRRLGSDAVCRLREPMVLGLWSGRSLTRSAGAEALEDGYRSPSRRVYSDLIYRKRALHGEAPTDEEITEALAAVGNYVSPVEVTEI